MIQADSVGDLVRLRAQACPDKVYYVCAESGKELSYAGLMRTCLWLDRKLSSLGVRPGDTVSVYMPNGASAATLLLGIMALGFVANPINLLCQPSQLRHVLLHSDTRLVFTTDGLAGQLHSPLSDLGRTVALQVVDAEMLVDEGDIREDSLHIEALHRVGSASTALLMYTSGTTGVPKGVMLTHGNLLASAQNLSEEHLLSETDRVLGSLPLYHINGLVVTLIAPLVHGGTVIMTNHFSVSGFWRNVVRYQCTWINVVPTMVAYLLNDQRGAQEADLGAVRFCRSASSALPPEHLRAFRRRFGIGIIETMGLTETAAPVFSNPFPESQRKVGSVGRPSGTVARIVDDDGNPVGIGQRGEIIVSGKNVMPGYYKDPERTREAFTKDGWLRTGDIGYQDKDGYFYVIGRAKELIIKGGENIAPREIDEVVVKHPSVLDAAAVGMPHPDYGQDIAVYVVLRENAVFDGEDLRRHCVKELGNFKTPSKFVVVDELPRGPSGKVQRLKLAIPA